MHLGGLLLLSQSDGFVLEGELMHHHNQAAATAEHLDRNYSLKVLTNKAWSRIEVNESHFLLVSVV